MTLVCDYNKYNRYLNFEHNKVECLLQNSVLTS